MTKANITFIGGGNMARSLIGGLVQRGFDPGAIRVSEPVASARAALATDFGVTVCSDNTAACADADLVVLAVKPQVMETVARTLAAALGHHPVVVSIAAGIPVAALQGWLGRDCPVIRCMPNTPALVHQGASGLYGSPQVSSAQRVLAEQVFRSVGLVIWLHREEDIDAVTALSGSGPAYFFLLMEAMQSAAEALGLDSDTARQLTLQTALGAATMAASDTVSAAELRRRVTSPGGTTEKAIATFMAGNLAGLVADAMTAARDRAGEMACEFSPPTMATGEQQS